MPSHPYQQFEEVIAASQAWIAAFNAGNPEACANGYTADAFMEARPFGSFQGRDSIRAFWADLMTKACNLRYHRPGLQLVDDGTVLLSSDWSMDIAKGRIHCERWVRQPGGAWLLQEDRFAVAD